MKSIEFRTNQLKDGIRLALALPLLGGLMAPAAFGATVNLSVKDELGNPVNGFRWVLEEDDTIQSPPGVRVTDSLSLRLHTSKAPVVASGESPTGEAGTTTLSFTEQPGKRYFVSVLPFDGGHTLGGVPVNLSGGTATVTAQVTTHNLPTAQVSVFVFQDNNPINNAPDLPGEQPSPASCGAGGLCPQQFTVRVFDGGGGYGATGPGPLLADAFGNPLGTEYDTDGNVVSLGNGIIHPNADGVAIIKNLVPGKYGIEVIPPAGQGWHQTTTIEGTKAIDAWVEAGNPPFFAEFGPAFYHTFFGFVKEFTDSSVLTGGATVTGRVLNDHFSRPPLLTGNNGAPFPECRIALNDASGRGVLHKPCNADSTFSIPNVPPGTYQLVVFDNNLDIIISFATVIVNPGQTAVAMGDIAVPAWFHTSRHLVYFDNNQNGFHDAGEGGMPLQNVNLRFRDGRVYQFGPTDSSGEIEFNETFPFFHWLVAEVDFARHKATGLTTVVDDGGPLTGATGVFPDYGALVPQPQFCTAADAAITGCALGAPLNNPVTGNNLSRTQTGVILTQAFQGFAGETNVFEWGKKVYTGTENGGVSGIVYYSNTRAEDDPRYGVGDPWEPGVPDATVNLYRATLDGNGNITARTLVNTVQTDSWDDAMPTGCQGPVFSVDPDKNPATNNSVPTDCLDGLRNFNQIRPGVYNGAYGFLDYCAAGLNSATGACLNGQPKVPMIQGNYVVEVVPPTGYQVVKEEDKNVALGDAWAPNPALLPPVCVGTGHLVPAYLSLQTDSAGNLVVPSDKAIAAPRAGQTHPLCDQKLVALAPRQNGVADFHLFTPVPKSARVVGTITNDLMANLDPTSPGAGEKLTPAWVPLSFRDWTGREIVRVHADEWGGFNALLPSSWTANAPLPSGFSPNMMRLCVNDPGNVPNPDFPLNSSVPFIQDPFYDRSYTTTCFTFQYMPASITYLDTPVLPQSAFAGSAAFPVDCEQPTTTPAIASIAVPAQGGGAYGLTGNQVVLRSAGVLTVPNPNFDGLGLTPQTAKTIKRNYGFGTSQGPTTWAAANRGAVILENQATGTRTELQSGLTWNQNQITFNLPNGGLPAGSYEVLVRKASATSTSPQGPITPVGVTLVKGPLPVGRNLVHVSPGAAGTTPIQNAIDGAAPGDLILVHSGNYDELVTLTKPVQLVGQGAYSTVIYGGKSTLTKLANWRDKVRGALANGDFDLLPGQPADPNLLFLTEEGAVVSVLGDSVGEYDDAPSRIDGFTLTGGENGGGLFVNGHARGVAAPNVNHLEILNNRVVFNSGNASGGIRIGHSNLADGGAYVDADNDNIRVRWNHIGQNGALGVAIGSQAAGGGVGLFKGADNYQVADNFVCGNFAQGHGGGIGHYGFSDNGRIERNTTVFNQILAGQVAVHGGGVFVGGAQVLPGQPATEGSGTVVIDSNRLQGNHAGAGDGGGLSLYGVNGADVAANLNPTTWDRVDVINNIIVNNVAAWAGGGIALQDALRVNIDHTTVANNDSTATAGQAFPAGNANQSTPQPAGIVAHQHSPALGDLVNNPNGFSAPLTLFNNIVWHNRSFYWVAANPGTPAAGDPALNAATGTYDDYGVLPVGLGSLSPLRNLTSANTPEGGAGTIRTNTSPFVSQYLNGTRKLTATGTPQAPNVYATGATFDEAGNAVSVEYGPLGQVTETFNAAGNTNPVMRGDYHLAAGTNQAVNVALPITSLVPGLGFDYDRNTRPEMFFTPRDIGADERYPATGTGAQPQRP
ncbi:hypothetical protein [Methylomagnum sp.]